MSEFRVQVVRLGPIEKHPNADSLSVTRVLGDYPVILRTGEYQPGDLAVYVPIDSVVPADEARWAFLGDQRRIKARRLRGIFSMGLLTPVEPGFAEGDEVREALRITKWEPPLPPLAEGEDEAGESPMPAYTDIEGLRRWPDVLQAGEEVVATEKVHGANGRFVFVDGRLWVGSRTRLKRESPGSLWWRAAHQHSLAEKLAAHPGVALYGEVYGAVQDLRYGARPNEVRLILFDALDTRTLRYLDYDDFTALAARLGLPVVPVLHRGPWGEEVRALANGASTLPGAAHTREGFVVRPTKERWHPLLGRVVLKLIGEDYLLRKGA